MLNRFFSSQLTLGLIQAAIAAAAALIVVLLARKRQIHLEKELVIAMVRGIIQMLRSVRFSSCC